MLHDEFRLVVVTGGALAANPRPLQSHLSYPACIASGNLAVSPILTVAHAHEASWQHKQSRRQVWLPRMRQCDACWAGEVSLRGLHFVNAE